MAIDPSRRTRLVNKAAPRTTIRDIDQSGSGFFSPSQPIRPMGPEDPAARGRILDYRVGANLTITPRQEENAYGGVSFWDLEMLAQNHDVTRLLIETRKDQMEALDWSIKPIDEFKDDEIPEELRKRIEQTQNFFKKPDGQTPFSMWMRELVDQVLVFDAPTVYINTSRPGDTRFEVFDGSTIKRLIDAGGRTPEPPDPAYQQIIKGLPAWDFSTEEMIYLPRNQRANRIYGYSPVEQIIMTVNIALRRQQSQLRYFTDGSVPDAFAEVPDTWTPDQIIEFQKNFDVLFEGDLAARRHVKFVPGGVKITQTKDVVLKNEFDEWLARIACYAFSVSPQPFVNMMNRATAGTAKEAAEEEGLAPLMRWFKQLMNIIIQEHLGQNDLCFSWTDKDDTDPKTRADIQDKKVRNGTMTINEARAQDGDEPIEGGDEAMIYMGPGPIPVRMITQMAEQQQEMAQAGFDAMQQATEDQGSEGSEEEGAAPGEEEGSDEEEPKKVQRSRTRRKSISKADDKGRGIFIKRAVTNADEIIAWYKSQGFKTALTPDSMHVTIAWSKEPHDWDALGSGPADVVIKAGTREVHALGDHGAVVMSFESSVLQLRFAQLLENGYKHKYEGYIPHITISYAAGDLDLAKVEPYAGVIKLGPEIWKEPNSNWQGSVKEAARHTGVGKHRHTPFRRKSHVWAQY